MTYIGMIFQYNAESKNGLLMLSDGQKQEFSLQEWSDEANEPKVGQKIAYIQTLNRIEIRVATNEDEENSLVSDQESEEEQSEEFALSSVEEYIEYFTSQGYKLVKETQTGQTRDVILRIYTPQDYGEATIKQVEEKISVTQTHNGMSILNITN